MLPIPVRISESPYFQCQIDIEKIEPERRYSKTELASKWGYDRKTIQRWHQIAIKFAPYYADGFAVLEHFATCDRCGHRFTISELQRKQIFRKSKTVCPGCRQRCFPETKSLEGIAKHIKPLGKYAQVLRLVGFLVSSLGEKAAIAALTRNPQYKTLRQQIRSLLK